MSNSNLSILAIATIVVGSLSFATPMLAAGNHEGGHGPDIGEPGDAAAADRTIEVVLHDNYFEPETIDVTAGETIRFVIRNEGGFVHEFNIGTAAMHEAHQEEMMMMMEHGVLQADSIDWQAAADMQESMGHGMHDDANAVLLEPGESAEVVWSFPQEGPLEFACNVPGHYASGMMGDFNLAP